MDPVAFFTAANVHIVAGKGGVGKSTVTAVMAVAAARVGLDVVVVDIEGRCGLFALFGLDPPVQDGRKRRDIATVPGIAGIQVRSLSADQALIDYLGDHGFGSLARRMVDSGVIEVVTRGAPGIKDILLLGKIKQLERAGTAQLILVDAPASGHAVTFLRSPRGLLDAVQRGPINNQAAEVMALLTDPRRCQVVLVTVAEETPVNELVETAFNLEEDLGIQLGPVIVNDLLIPLELPHDVDAAARDAAVTLSDTQRRALHDAAAFRRSRSRSQRDQLDRLGELLPLPRLSLAHRAGAGLARRDLDAMAEELLVAVAAL